VVGGVLGLALIIGAVIMFLRWRNMREPTMEQKGAESSSDAIGVPGAGKIETIVTTNSK
jgi:hypothetical protein